MRTGRYFLSLYSVGKAIEPTYARDMEVLFEELSPDSAKLMTTLLPHRWLYYGRLTVPCLRCRRVYKSRRTRCSSRVSAAWTLGCSLRREAGKVSKHQVNLHESPTRTGARSFKNTDFSPAECTFMKVADPQTTENDGDVATRRAKKVSNVQQPFNRIPFSDASGAWPRHDDH